MLTVLADDVTGAAEIAGVCLRYGLSVTFDFDFNIRRLPSTEVWVIASDTRSMPEKEACDAVRKIARRLKTLKVQAVFKKIDSALRGTVLPEIEALCEYFPAEKILILPGNPETGRT
ncbi:MAG: four-carbon acid sugar kinase family protein, partial [Tannerella sp.]|nr:four-carbon acid sugar kinase family protein [Tannerella sp.]